MVIIQKEIKINMSNQINLVDYKLKELVEESIFPEYSKNEKSLCYLGS